MFINFRVHLKEKKQHVRRLSPIRFHPMAEEKHLRVILLIVDRSNVIKNPTFSARVACLPLRSLLRRAVVVAM
jgi:hypothetical protein